MTVKATFTFWAGHKDKRVMRVDLFDHSVKSIRPDRPKEALREQIRQENPHIRFCRKNQDRLEIK